MAPPCSALEAIDLSSQPPPASAFVPRSHRALFTAAGAGDAGAGWRAALRAPGPGAAAQRNHRSARHASVLFGGADVPGCRAGWMEVRLRHTAAAMLYCRKRCSWRKGASACILPPPPPPPPYPHLHPASPSPPAAGLNTVIQSLRGRVGPGDALFSLDIGYGSVKKMLQARRCTVQCTGLSALDMRACAAAHALTVCLWTGAAATQRNNAAFVPRQVVAQQTGAQHVEMAVQWPVRCGSCR